MPKTSRPQLAGWWRRAGAFLIDGLVIAIPSFIVARRLNGTTTERLSVHLLFMFGGIAYGAILIRAQGKTLGMRAVSIAALDLRNGRNITTGAAWLRSVVAFAFFGLTSEILFLYGATRPPGWSSHSYAMTGLVSLAGLLLSLTFLLPIVDPRNQTLQDKAAGSVVICEPRSHPGWRSWSSF
jgi:uncharacterized RDD family membrane protein YckC